MTTIANAAPFARLGLVLSALCGVTVLPTSAVAQQATPIATALPANESQLPPGDMATALSELKAQPKVDVPVPKIGPLRNTATPPDYSPMWIEKLREGLYLIRGPIGPCMNACAAGRPAAATQDGVPHEPGDVAVLVTSEGVILVDDKYAVNVPEIISLVKSVTDQAIKYVVNTHYHTDHAGGNSEMLKRGVTVVAQQALRDSYDRGKSGGETPHVTFGNYGSVQLGGAKVELYHLGPGHTAGDTTVYFPDLKIIHMGDVVIGGMPHIDYPDGGTALGMVAEIYDMLKLDWDFAIPGHGPVMSRDEVRDYAKKYEKLLARMKQIVLQGIPRNKAAAALRLDDLGWANSASTTTFLRLDVGHFYDEMARAIAAQAAGNERPAQALLSH
jgi:glyoxylase-like metal-dependent hydrolase (beta-lactamase superfamily II)